MIALSIFIIVLLVLVNSFYVAAEFAAVSVRSNQVRKLADEGSGLARKLHRILADPAKLDKYIAACQIGITLSSLLLGAYGQITLTAYLSPLLEKLGDFQTIAANSLSATIVLIGLTIFQVVIGELVPKSLAMQYPLHTALYTYLPMRWSLSAFSWFIKILNGSGLLILKLLRIPPVTHRHIHSREEISSLLDESLDAGLLAPDDHSRLQNGLELSGLRIGQIMIPDIHLRMLPIDASLDDLLALVHNAPDTHIPIYDGARTNVVGMIHAKELVPVFARRGEIPPIREMVRKIPFAVELQTVDKLLAIMRSDQAQQVLVLDEYGKFVGLVTMERILEEMMGDIGEEFKRVPQHVQVLKDGSIRLPGSMRRHKAAKYFPELDSIEGDANTLNGCLIQQLTRRVHEGEKIKFAGRDIIIEKLGDLSTSSILLLPEDKQKNKEKGGRS